MHEPFAIILHEGFQRVAEGVAKIEQRAISRLGFIACDNGSLGLAGNAHGFLAFRPT